MDWLPRPELLDECIRCSEKLGFPMLTGSYQYMLGRDDAALERDMRNAARAGLKLHNIMIFANAADGHEVTDEEVVACYLQTAELGDKLGVVPSFEVHAKMWSEQFPRVARVAKTVRSRARRSISPSTTATASSRSRTRRSRIFRAYARMSRPAA